MKSEDRVFSILHVEDEVGIGEIFSKFFQRGSKIKYSFAQDVSTAEKKLVAGNFDCLWLDISLCGESGLSFFERIRTGDLLDKITVPKSIPVFFLCGADSLRPYSNKGTKNLIEIRASLICSLNLDRNE